MKQIDKITIRLEKLFNDMGMYELYACADDCFSYGEDTDNMPTVFYSIISDDIDNICDKLYAEFYKQETGKNLPISNYTFSILHEIGHHKTIKQFTGYDIIGYQIDCCKLAEKRKRKEITIEEEQSLYMRLPIEEIATKTACKLVQENIKLLKEFEKDIKILFENLQKALDNE